MSMVITGASGFVGSFLGRSLTERDIVWHKLARSQALSDALSGATVLIHLAARAHVMRDTAADPRAAFREVNVDATLTLAAQAAALGLQRFVFISSVKVQGELTSPGRPFFETDVPVPQDAYALSKWEAEQGLREISAASGMEVVIIRPPLVYGPGVKANFAALMRAVQRGLPLPLGAVDNLRSLVGLDNLVHFIITCAKHPAAANQTFLVSDGEDISTTDLIRAMARAAGRSARLFPVPAGVLASIAPLLGKRAAIDRLCSSLQVDISKARDVLQWTPPVSLDEGLRRAFIGVSA